MKLEERQRRLEVVRKWIEEARNEGNNAEGEKLNAKADKMRDGIARRRGIEGPMVSPETRTIVEDLNALEPTDLWELTSKI